MPHCPYLGAETGEDFNVEHIIPEAIGGRKDYAIQVSKVINSRFGETIDAALVNHPQIRALCVHFQIKGKSGVPTLKVRGEALDLGLKLDFTASDETHINVRVRNPVAPAPDDEGLRVLTYMDGQGSREMERIAKDVAKDGKEVIWEQEQPLDEVEVRLYNDGNPFLAALGMAKIAFGGLLYEFPEFGKDPAASAWRNLLNASSPKEAHESGVEFSAYNQPEAVKALIPVAIQPWEHVVSIANCGPAGIFVAVSLFGLENFHFFARASTSSDNGMQEGEIRMHVCDTQIARKDPRAPTTRTVICRVSVDVDAECS